ncbi:hypothetical protein BKA69DRAFT_1048111 [Paraphysoderma sedebokerense]|nr:hypothetical protein BKA69DRAFT_1048111 [Paraphysoderma sedebokerense]
MLGASINSNTAMFGSELKNHLIRLNQASERRESLVQTNTTLNTAISKISALHTLISHVGSIKVTVVPCCLLPDDRVTFGKIESVLAAKVTLEISKEVKDLLTYHIGMCGVAIQLCSSNRTTQGGMNYPTAENPFNNERLEYFFELGPKQLRSIKDVHSELYECTFNIPISQRFISFPIMITATLRATIPHLSTDGCSLTTSRVVPIVLTRIPVLLDILHFIHTVHDPLQNDAVENDFELSPSSRFTETTTEFNRHVIAIIDELSHRRKRTVNSIDTWKESTVSFSISDETIFSGLMGHLLGEFQDREKLSRIILTREEARFRCLALPGRPSVSLNLRRMDETLASSGILVELIVRSRRLSAACAVLQALCRRLSSILDFGTIVQPPLFTTSDIYQFESRISRLQTSISSGHCKSGGRNQYEMAVDMNIALQHVMKRTRIMSKSTTD